MRCDRRNGERVPVRRGDGLTGMWSVIITELKPGGYSPILAGSSYIRIIGWNSDGTVDPRGIRTYSPHEDPKAEHGGDLTCLYATGEMVRLPVSVKEIAADQQLVVVRVRKEPAPAPPIRA